jgi:transcriptional regulator with XRE-family HTH domain
MYLREVFATNLRRLRHAKGLSQDDLASDVLEVEAAELLRVPPKRARRKG